MSDTVRTPLDKDARQHPWYARRQVRKKVAGVAAIVVNCNSIISLLRERILKLRDKGIVSMWHEGFLNCV